MGQRPDIGSGADPSSEPGLPTIPIQNFKFLDLNLFRLEFDFLLLAGELIGWNAGNLFGRKWRWNLFDLSRESGGNLLNLLQGQVDWLFRALGFACGVVGVRGQSELDRSFVPFISFRVKLGKAGEAAQYQGQDAGGGGIKSPQMPYGTLIDDAAHASDHIVRSHSSRFVDDQDSIHLSNSELSSMIAKAITTR